MNEQLIEAARARIDAAAAGKGDNAELREHLHGVLNAVGQVRPIVIEGGRQTVFFGPHTYANLHRALSELAGEDACHAP